MTAKDQEALKGLIRSMRELLAQVMREWTAKGGTARSRLLVVLIDDLDRCSPTNASAGRGRSAVLRFLRIRRKMAA